MDNFAAYPELQPAGSDPSGNPMAEVLGPLMAGGGIILHGEQEFTYERPVLAGDVLVGEAKWSTPIARSRKGDHDLRGDGDGLERARAGTPVCTSRMNIIHRS